MSGVPERRRSDHPPLAVSVVIPTYNRSSIVGRAIESALAAQRADDEVLVVDDGSTDDTVSLLRGRYGSSIRLLLSPHGGVSAARNLGVASARNPLVALLDSDDVWMPDKLDLQRTVMQRRPEVAFCFTDFGHQTRTGAQVRRYLSRWHHDPRGWDEILGPGVPFSTLGELPPAREDFLVHVGDMYPVQLNGDYICTSTVMVRRERAGPALHFPEDLRRLEDWECFSRLAKLGPGAFLDCETQWNCDHAGPRLTRSDELYSEVARVKVLERVWGRDPGFLEAWGLDYRRVLVSHQLALAKALLAVGRTREARDQLRVAGGGSIVDRILASLPGPLTWAIVTARRTLRRKRRITSPSRKAERELGPR